jgi:hypothetical protein
MDWERAARRDRNRQARRDEVADQAVLGRLIKLKFPATCGVCGQRIRPGAKARWSPDGWTEHLDCGERFLQELLDLWRHVACALAVG